MVYGGRRACSATSHRTTDGEFCSCEVDIMDWYRLYGRGIREFVLSRTGEYTIADDCASETFLRAMLRRDQFRCNGSGIRPWLFTIARNIVRDYHRSASRRREFPMEVVPEKRDPGMSPEQAIVWRETTDEVTGVLAELSGDQAVCLQLRFLDRLSVTETAQVMGRDEAAVRALQYRATRKAASILAGKHQERTSPPLPSARGRNNS